MKRSSRLSGCPALGARSRYAEGGARGKPYFVRACCFLWWTISLCGNAASWGGLPVGVFNTPLTNQAFLPA